MPLNQQMTTMRLVSPQATQDKARVAMAALDRYTYSSGTWGEVSRDFDRYLQAVRAEFGLPPMTLAEEILNSRK